MRTSRIVDLEEKDVEQVFPNVLQQAYNGKLSADEYI